jgi:hypothetical protein
VIVDIAAEVRAALSDPVLRREFAQEVAAEVVAQIRNTGDAPLEPLHKILGCSVAAARMKVQRSAALSAIAVDVGSGKSRRKLLFKRDAVFRVLDERKGAK